MQITQVKPVTFDEFIDWYPENAIVRYELRRGEIIEMPKPRGDRSKVAGKLAGKLSAIIDKADLPYFIPREGILRRSEDTGYEPDVIILDETEISNEPRWDRGSIIEHGSTIKLAIEVVSSNWQDDYEFKMADYEAMGIPEYWIVDYAGLGGTRHIGKPKQPTLTVCTLIDGEYEIHRFRGEDIILSPTFPALNLTAAQVLTLGK
ncbi:MAG: hypothetical protein B0A82_04645 [Alkalinema sp. CACIAM 70d]|nr:MAG: hypothetical protein B0A82_04645 [Alkalinema sp. CACIAM 70d]